MLQISISISSSSSSSSISISASISASISISIIEACDCSTLQIRAGLNVKQEAVPKGRTAKKARTAMLNVASARKLPNLQNQSN